MIAQPTLSAVLAVPSATADINVSDEILRMCNIAFSNIATAVLATPRDARVIGKKTRSGQLVGWVSRAQTSQ